MTLFEYLSVTLSIVISLGAAPLLGGFVLMLVDPGLYYVAVSVG